MPTDPVLNLSRRRPNVSVTGLQTYIHCTVPVSDITCIECKRCNTEPSPYWYSKVITQNKIENAKLDRLAIWFKELWSVQKMSKSRKISLIN